MCPTTSRSRLRMARPASVTSSTAAPASRTSPCRTTRATSTSSSTTRLTPPSRAARRPPRRPARSTSRECTRRRRPDARQSAQRQAPVHVTGALPCPGPCRVRGLAVAPTRLRDHVLVTSPAGYSGTPLHRKLGVKPGSRVLLSAAPPGFALDEVPADAMVHTRAAGSSYDVIVAFCPDRSRLDRRFGPLAVRLTTAGAAWGARPQAAGGGSPGLGRD